MELEGSSAATGSYDYIYLNGPTDNAPDPNAGTLTVASGATFNDETTGYLYIQAPNEGASDTGANAAVNNEGTWIKSGSASTSYIDTAFNNAGAVSVQDGILDLQAAVSGTGTETISGSSTVEFDSTVASGPAVKLLASQVRLIALTQGDL